MKIRVHTLPALVRELIDENPFACRALLQVVSVEWSKEVPTAAMSCGAHPRMMVNPQFVEAHCRTDAELKALLMHEFLHVLLRHTEGRGPASDEQHIAWDAVINAIIHRSMGPACSALMSRYYANEKGARLLLRPPRPGEKPEGVGREGDPDTISGPWLGLYQHGTVVADDIEDLARELKHAHSRDPDTLLLGNHDATEAVSPEALMGNPVHEALQRALSTMNGSGIWRGPPPWSLAAELTALRQTQDKHADIRRWRHDAMAVLRRHLSPDARAERQLQAEAEYRLPVLGSADRRAFSRALWSPLIPEATWLRNAPVGRGSAQVYLDVSGSMNTEMPHIVALLAQLRGLIRRPFWAFSNEVAPARIEEGRLITRTTGGTSMGCVLEHIAQTRPSAAVVVTDGWIEPITRQQAQAAGSTRLHAIVTRQGSPHALAQAGIAYTQLRRIPT